MKISTDAITNINPDIFIRRFVTVSIVSILTILLFSCYGIFRVSFSFVIDNAEGNAVSLANSLAQHVIERLASHGEEQPVELEVTAATRPLFEADLHDSIEHFSIIKVKLFNRQAQLIYSSDNSNVGRFDKDNRRLANALAGHNDSQAVKKDKIQDFNGQERFEVDVVETYVPVRDRQGNVIGSFELYQDITRYYREIIPFVVESGGIIFLILSAGFVMSFWLLRKKAEHLKAAQQILKNQACTDFLTGLYNRRQLLFRCEEEISRLKRIAETDISAGSLACIMIDIDHFKQVNDTYGHAAGDEVIRELANRLRKETRPYDIVGRYGGEEFLVIICCDSDEELLPAIAERLWSSVRSEPFSFEGRNINITISLGVALIDVTDSGYETLVKKADRALYQAKNEGRDRICFDTPHTGSIHAPGASKPHCIQTG